MDNTKLVRILAEGLMRWVTMDDWTENEFVSDDSGAVFVDEPNNIAHLDWNPIEDWNDCMMLVEQMVELEYILDIKWKTEIFSASFFNYDGSKSGYDWIRKSEHKQKKPLEAICIAVARARGLIDG